MRLFSLFVFVLVLCGCPTDPEPEPPVRFMGQDPAVPAAAGEARAGVIRDGAAGEAALFGGIGAEGQAGDIKIYNPHVQFIVQNAGRRHGWIDVGGTVVDADLVRPAGQLGRDALDDAFLSFGLSRLYEADSVEIVADGSDGPAVIRTSGTDVQWDFFARGLESDDLLLGPQELAIVREFELAGDSDSLKITTTFKNVGSVDVSVRPAEGAQTSKEDFAAWFSGRGLVDGASGEFGAAGFYGLRNEGVFSIWSEDGPNSVFPGASIVSVASLSMFSQGLLELAPGESTTRVTRYTLGSDLLAAEGSRRRLQGLEVGTVAGVVTDEGTGEPVAGARVHFVQEGEVAGFALTAGDGRYSATLPPGTWDAWVTARHLDERVELPSDGVGRYGPMAADSVNAAYLEALTEDAGIPFAGGRWTADPVAVELAADQEVSLDLVMAPAGRLELTIVDDAGAPLPGIALLHHDVVPESPVPDDLREALGLPYLSLRLGWLWTSTGEVSIPVPPGRYTVEIGHSPRHERSGVLTVEVPEGGGGSLDVVLPEVVPRDGWISADAHLHAAPSMDGETAMESRLVACAAAGLDAPVMTDHDRFADYAPLATALGLDDRMTVIPGTEVTTIVRGHFNLFPVDVGPQDAPNRGALVWWDRDPTTTGDLTDRVRAAGRDDSLLQVNHGRLTLGMMGSAGYDEQVGEPDHAGYWSWDFDQTEIVTAGDRDDWLANRDDWFSFVSLGLGTIPIGASDSHGLGRACGLGRTDVYVGDAADGPTVTDIRDAIADGHVVVASGVTLRATLDGALPGDTVTGTPGDLQVTVRGPQWIRPATLNLWRDGELVETLELEPPDADGLIFEGPLALDATADSWFAVEVDGGDPQGHAWGGHPPYAITNAFLVDVAGDGWDPPGLPARR